MTWNRWHNTSYITSPKCWEEVFEKIKIPNKINTIIDLGCAAGRNLLYYNNRYNLIGVDLPKKEDIEFYPLNNFEYISCPIQNLPTTNFNTYNLNDCLVISHGSLMYISPQQQFNLINSLLNQNCKNFIFQEYDYIHPAGSHNNVLNDGKTFEFNPLNHKSLFKKEYYRKEMPSWIYLNT